MGFQWILGDLCTCPLGPLPHQTISKSFRVISAGTCCGFKAWSGGSHRSIGGGNWDHPQTQRFLTILGGCTSCTLNKRSKQDNLWKPTVQLKRWLLPYVFSFFFAVRRDNFDPTHVICGLSWHPRRPNRKPRQGTRGMTMAWLGMGHGAMVPWGHGAMGHCQGMLRRDMYMICFFSYWYQLATSWILF